MSIDMDVYARVLAGDEQARNTFITQLVEEGLVYGEVADFVGRRQDIAYLRDEMVSEGSVTLIEAVNALIAAGPVADPQPRAYIKKAVRRRIREVVNEDDSLGASDRTQRRHRSSLRQSGKLPRQVQADMEMLSNTLTDEPQQRADEAREAIQDCCLDRIDLRICELREQGYSDREIGEQVGLGTSAINARRAAIYQRFLERSEIDKGASCVCSTLEEGEST